MISKTLNSNKIKATLLFSTTLIVGIGSSLTAHAAAATKNEFSGLSDSEKSISDIISQSLKVCKESPLKISDEQINKLKSNDDHD
jgi:regulatory protein YycI of two-component signal transduction system YycFG